MGDQPTSSKTREIYVIIAIGSIGFFLGIYFLIINRDGEQSNSTPEPVISQTNNIIENINIPIACKKALDAIDCIVRTTSGENESLRLYRQKISSEWNIIEKSQLQKACDTQLQYLQSLSGTYNSCIR